MSNDRQRTIEILKGNRSLFARREREWLKHSQEAGEEKRKIDLQLRALNDPHEDDIEGRQLDLLDHIDGQPSTIS